LPWLSMGWVSKTCKKGNDINQLKTIKKQSK
jgi:hypothetical protein